MRTCAAPFQHTPQRRLNLVPKGSGPRVALTERPLICFTLPTPVIHGSPPTWEQRARNALVAPLSHAGPSRLLLCHSLVLGLFLEKKATRDGCDLCDLPQTTVTERLQESRWSWEEGVARCRSCGVKKRPRQASAITATAERGRNPYIVARQAKP